MYDGLGPSAQALVGALTRLTGLPDLSHLTLLPWRGFLSTRNGALRWRRPNRWCCRCLAHWRGRGTELWEPLLWRVSAVQRCPVHRIPFSELCSRCHARQGVVSEIVPFGHCRKCGHALEADDPLRQDWSAGARLGVQALWEWWTSVAVGRMLASQRLLARSGSPRGFQELLRRSLDRAVDPSVKLLAQYLDFGWNSIEVWMNGKRSPRLSFFLAVCMRLGADPLQIAVAHRFRLSVTVFLGSALVRLGLRFQARFVFFSQWWTVRRRRSHARVAAPPGPVWQSQRLPGVVRARVRAALVSIGRRAPLSRSGRRPVRQVACSVSRLWVELNRGLDEREALSAPQFLPRCLHCVSG